jgi:hypothetical protein
LNNVRGSLISGNNVAVTQGDDVFRDEAVRTEIDSTAKLLLQASISLGPSSSIKLDRFVYAGPERTGVIAVNLVKGALRFATDNANKVSYTITTPTATLGVRGTILRIESTAERTTVVLEDGATIVCTRLTKVRHCVDLTRFDAQVVVTPEEVSVENTSPAPAATRRARRRRAKPSAAPRTAAAPQSAAPAVRAAIARQAAPAAALPPAPVARRAAALRAVEAPAPRVAPLAQVAAVAALTGATEAMAEEEAIPAGAATMATVTAKARGAVRAARARAPAATRAQEPALPMAAAARATARAIELRGGRCLSDFRAP